MQDKASLWSMRKRPIGIFQTGSVLEESASLEGLVLAISLRRIFFGRKQSIGMAEPVQVGQRGLNFECMQN